MTLKGKKGETKREFVLWDRGLQQSQKINILSASVPEKLAKRTEYDYLSGFLHNPKSGNNSTFHYNWQSRQTNSAVCFCCNVICFFWVIIWGKSCAILSLQFKRRALLIQLTQSGISDNIRGKMNSGHAANSGQSNYCSLWGGGVWILQITTAEA